MVRSIQLSVAFVAAVEAQLAYLADHGRPEWIGRLRDELAALETSVSTFPSLGRERDQIGMRVLRKLGLPRAPFSVWYASDEAAPDGAVTFLAFFHDRQRGRAPRL